MNKNVTLTLERAKAMYESNIPVLKDLALEYYTETELNPNYKTFDAYVELVKEDIKTQRAFFNIPKYIYNEVSFALKLHILAIHFNNNWKKTKDNIGYYIIKDNDTDEYCVCSSINYTPGIIYFEEKKDAFFVSQLLNNQKNYGKNSRE